MTKHNSTTDTVAQVMARASAGERRPANGSIRSRAGQGMIEFSLGIITLMMIFCAIFEFGWIFYNLAFINNWAAKALRQAEVMQGKLLTTVSTSVAGVLSGAPGGLPISLVSITTNGGATLSTGNTITITAQCSYTSLTPLSRLGGIVATNLLKITCQGVAE